VTRVTGDPGFLYQQGIRADVTVTTPSL